MKITGRVGNGSCSYEVAKAQHLKTILARYNSAELSGLDEQSYVAKGEWQARFTCAACTEANTATNIAGLRIKTCTGSSP